MTPRGESRLRKLARRVKTLARVLVGKDMIVRRDIACATQRFGSAYGGWDACAERLRADSVVYSFGVGEDASFDVELLKKFGMTVHAFDPTPKSIDWAKKQGFPSQFVLHEYGIANYDGDATFSPPDNPEDVSHTMLERPNTKGRSITVPVKRLASIMRELGHAAIDLLKMDIEGAEYDVINTTLSGSVM
jgi:FkbM family methyltransferase